jgi:hypothetical protein
MGALAWGRWIGSTGGEARFSRARLIVVPDDIIEMSDSFHSQMLHLSLCEKTQNPARLLASRVGKSYESSATCLPSGYLDSLRAHAGTVRG